MEKYRFGTLIITRSWTSFTLSFQVKKSLSDGTCCIDVSSSSFRASRWNISLQAPHNHDSSCVFFSLVPRARHNVAAKEPPCFGISPGRANWDDVLTLISLPRSREEEHPRSADFSVQVILSKELYGSCNSPN